MPKFHCSYSFIIGLILEMNFTPQNSGEINCTLHLFELHFALQNPVRVDMAVGRTFHPSKLVGLNFIHKNASINVTLEKLLVQTSPFKHYRGENT